MDAITIQWNPEDQDVEVGFDAKAFKNWDFVAAILHIAQAKVETQRRLVLAANMQQQARDHMLRQQVARGLKNGN